MQLHIIAHVDIFRLKVLLKRNTLRSHSLLLTEFLTVAVTHVIRVICHYNVDRQSTDYVFGILFCATFSLPAVTEKVSSPRFPGCNWS